MRSKLSAMEQRLDKLAPPVCDNCAGPPVVVERYEGDPDDSPDPLPCLDPRRCTGSQGVAVVVIRHHGTYRDGGPAEVPAGAEA